MSTILTEADASKALDIAPGETIEIRLKGNPSTGYIWESSETVGAELTESSYENYNTQGRVGASGTFWFRYHIRSSGHIRLIYRRPWEPSSGNQSQFSVTIKADRGLSLAPSSPSSTLALIILGGAVAVAAWFAWRRAGGGTLGTDAK
ncbi:hypothetical protein M427DRAFT_143288 [Gonapodya prolifera JEL478]|uniref:Proteinase inhibitor I42 chagasin domain-containing protein n=1 Tax=Gonapodya prolifera (strain JEL478) TaxID=1344416 RepID=A0A139AS96_GONPJ|nr:hypothetical protein M427DRAFT_143288 [Gonapodya prolifera JEL478]|eukprot:KXS19524.1 hypothetical protein M427DRAFT_143288 [Gonapodya prolifera JEL478]